LNILVTGGAGFIGSNIVEYLLKNNVKFVRVLDNLSTGKKENLQFLLEKYPKKLEFIWGDIGNLENCRKAVKGMDVICHQAALGSVPRSIADPLSSHNSNVNGYFNILLSAKEEGIKRVVYASSSSVYGDHPKLPKEEKNTGKLLSPYAVTKAIDEMYGWIFHQCYGMETIGYRYFNVFGPRQDPKGVYAAVIPKFIDMVQNKKSPTINGDGSYSRDFTYIDNVVKANVIGLITDNKKAFGEVFNIGAEGRVTILELFETIKKHMNSDVEVIFGPLRPGDIPHSNADVGKAKDILGYKPLVDFSEGIKRTVNYFMK
jgi:UDP-N-acetylglucosamine 4-epimerase